MRPKDQRDARWHSFIGFWIAAAIALLALGIAVLAQLPHGRRIGAALVGLAVVCFIVALTVRRATVRR